MRLKLRKIFRIASYDFRRLLFNPISLMVLAIIMVACTVVCVVHKIPVTPEFSAATYGTTTREIYNNFMLSSSANLPPEATDLDTKSALDKLLDGSIISAQTDNTYSETFLQANKNMQKFYEEKLKNYELHVSYDPLYVPEEDILSSFNQAAEDLTKFVANFQDLQEFEANMFFTKAQFSQLKTVVTFFEDCKSLSGTKLVLNALVNGKQNFVLLQNLASENAVATWKIGADQLEDWRQQYIVCGQQKAAKIQREIERINAEVETVPTDQSYVDEMQSLITNYKLTAQSAYNGVVMELKLLFMSKFGNLNNFQGMTNVPQEEIEVALVKAKHFLADQQVYYTRQMQPLNFNTASAQVTVYDSTYFMVALIGLTTIMFSIFCAYKLFGRDRKLGKIDIVLSQNVTFGQVFTAKFLAIVAISSTLLAVFSAVMFLWSALFYSPAYASILAVFNFQSAYTIHPMLFLLIKIVAIELQAIFYAVFTIFMMNISRKFELNFCISALVFVAATICNTLFNHVFVYCLFPFVHTDLSALIGGGKINAGFLQTALYSHGNFFISLTYYLMVTITLFFFTKHLFKKN